MENILLAFLLKKRFVRKVFLLVQKLESYRKYLKDEEIFAIIFIQSFSKLRKSSKLPKATLVVGTKQGPEPFNSVQSSFHLMMVPQLFVHVMNYSPKILNP